MVNSSSRFSFCLQIIQIIQTQSQLCHLFYALFAFHTFSFVSSSFIEEEHQTWYYLCHTAFTLICFKDIVQQSRPSQRKFLKWCLFIILHLVIRRLNQTGDKWINAPDIGDFLAGHEKLLRLTFILGLVLVFVALQSFIQTKTDQILVVIALVLIFLYREDTRLMR